jgi:Fe-S cluster assembly protein SufD
MSERTVRRIISTGKKESSGEFAFTREMIPVLANKSAPQFLRDYRARAWDTYSTLPMPTTKDEAWRRTDLRPLQAADFHIAGNGRDSKLPKWLLKPLVSNQHGGQIILKPDGAQVSLSEELSSKGVIFVDLVTAERQYPQILERVLGQVVRFNEGKFAALAAAQARSGALVYVPRGVQLEQPLHSVLWGIGTGLAYFSHLVIWLEEGASVTYVHEAASPNEKGQTFHAGIVEIHVGEGANLRFVELQSWGDHVWNFSHERAIVQRDANLDWIFGALGSHLTKNFSTIDLAAQGATGRMSGFYFTDGTQHLDHDSQQNHLAPHTTSDLLFKGALKGQSRSVWQGMIYVAPNAQQTDGYQANRNLVLSPQARADSIPGLEILANDVRCTHGATVGKIDPEQIFFLMSRGIPRPEAERLIVKGFFDPIMQRIPFEGVRARFQQAIETKMK